MTQLCLGAKAHPFQGPRLRPSPASLKGLARGSSSLHIPHLLPAPGRFPFVITDRVTVVILEPIDGLVIVGYFVDGQLVRMVEEPAGEA